ncbi:apoptotic chromatin condensation inducer 1b isoform X2 [Solea solea]|uniref:apoptotic chromatin condensation inducer 1b isoform X2 n=1 Tax=Solea solea TaxID=90069 RepID=UPI00272C8592|nr:apoptotic chromatin condensation inducer 1b isoform X2 [Solea solea]
MADEDITLDGKPLQSLRVADLKAALEQRNLPKSGQKNTLIKRLKGALMLENLQKSSSSHTHSALQPNSQIGEEMCQNSFIKQYLAKQQELLRQRLEREAQQEEEADESPAVPEDDDEHLEDNDSFSYVSTKNCPIPSQSTLSRAEEKGGGDSVVGHRMMAYSTDMDPSLAIHCQESSETPGPRMQQAAGHKEPPVPSPPRAVASLSVRVLGKPDRQGLPPVVPRVQEKEGTAPNEPGSAHPVLHLSRSAGVSSGSHVLKDSDDEDDSDDERDDDDDWGPGPGKARKGNRVPPQPQQMSPTVAGGRSKRKLQVPQHIPPPQVQHTPMQLRHPTPPPSPPPNLFPLPDTPKQSPPDQEDQEGKAPALGPRMGSFPPPTMQRQDSDSSSCSSSPEPPVKRRPGPLSLLVHKMESEGAFCTSTEKSEDTSHSTAGSSTESPQQKLERKRQNEDREMEGQLKKEERERTAGERKKAQEQEREKKHMEEEKERKQIQEEEREKERKCQEEAKERKHQEEEKEKERICQDEKRREENHLKKEQDKRQQMVNKDRKVATVTEGQDSGSSSDSDSKSDSSSQSSSSSSSRDKASPARQLKKVEEAEDEKTKTNLCKEVEKQHLSKREVSEPSAAAVTEVEPESESSMAEQPASEAEPENSENRLEESTTPKAFAARKISLTSSKSSPATTDGGGEGETGTAAAGRKRRWGSSTAVTTKKPSISITTDSLKSLIPDIKINQEAVVDLHPEELQLSEDESNQDNSRSDEDKGLKIRRTVTQVVPGDSQENGQTNEEEEVEKKEREKQRRVSRDKRKSSLSEEASESQTSVKTEEDEMKVTPSDSLVRRSISQQKTGVSVTIDDPVRTAKQLSPPRGKISNIIHVTNLVRPFTLGQLKELLNRTGTVVEEGFWIDKIKSHCFVTYATTDEAVATRTAIHGVKWPLSNPKVLSVDFCEQDELDFHKGVLKPEIEDHVVQPVVPQNRLPPLMPERDREHDRDRDRDRECERDRERGAAGVRDIWAEREREMERRERARGEREWDRDKIREFARPGEDGRRSRSRERERKRKDRAKSKERKTDKKEKGDEPPAKLLDDLFLKTKAAPCIYWLPLSEEQSAQRLLDREERQKERERRRKEQEEEEDKKREEEKKERLKAREKDVAVTVGGGAAGRGADADRERDRGRDREGDKRRDSGHRPRRPSAGAGSGRRSRSRSNPRDRRR